MTRTRGAVWIAALAAAAVLAACGSPLAGRWVGTADLGPIAAYDIEISIPDGDGDGTVALREPDMPEKFRICQLVRRARSVEIVYDAGRPDCDGVGPTPSDRRTLKGEVGEGVLTGEVWRAGVKTGFFRAFLRPAGAEGPSSR